MLRKILITLVVIGMAVTFGCKKKEAAPAAPEVNSAPQAQTDANAQ